MDIKAVLEKLNIDKWHNQGITGNGVKVAVLGYERGAHHNGAWLISQAAPGCSIKEINVMKGGASWEMALRECIVEGANVICCSLRKYTWSEELELLSKGLYDSGCIMIDSADNEGEEIDAWPAKSKYWLVAGAYNHKDQAPYNYSSYGPKLDFVSYTGIDTPTAKGDMIPLTHTSGAVQIPAAMAALLKESHKITPEGFKEFIAENSMDILNEGKDDESGWGVLKMPENVYQNEIRLTIGKDTMEVNGETKPMDTAPFIKDSRTFVPVRFIAEALGAKIEWDEQAQQVIIKK